MKIHRRKSALDLEKPKSLSFSLRQQVKADFFFSIIFLPWEKSETVSKRSFGKFPRFEKFALLSGCERISFKKSILSSPFALTQMLSGELRS